MKWTYDEVARHTSRDDCYVILYNKVYDLTKFLPEHPGGASIILKNAGKDATYVTAAPLIPAISLTVSTRRVRLSSTCRLNVVLVS